MKSPKLKALSLMALVVIAVNTGCAKEDSFSEASRQKATDGLSVLEKARIARATRKMVLDEKRKLIAAKYADSSAKNEKVKVFFENEMVTSKELNMWVQPDYFAVLKTSADQSSAESTDDSITLFNEKEGTSVQVVIKNDPADQRLKDESFCRTIAQELSHNTSFSMMAPPFVMKGNRSSICHVSYHDQDLDRFVHEYTEVYDDGAVVQTRTESVSDISSKAIIKKAFSNAVAPMLKSSARHCMEDFLATETYSNSEI